MKKKVPLHSLVIIIGDDEQKNRFSPHECISSAQVHIDLVGKNQRPELDSIIRNEVFRRCALKLSLGERVVFHGSKLSRDQRAALAKMAISQGSPVFYLIGNDVQPSSIDDGFGEVITDADPVFSIPTDELKNKFRGITVVGDVHGDVKALSGAVSWARDRNHFLWFLGDVIDYGPHPLEAMDIVHKLVMQGLAATLIGNHERKIAKWLQQKDEHKHRIRLSDGNKVTVDAYNRLSSMDQMIWCGKFRSVLARSSLIASIGNITLAHAAIHPDYWLTGKNSEIESFALYGEPDPNSPNEFRLAHSWIEYVPAGQIVIVGHESHGIPYPVPITCQNGGKVIFLDTDCGKGGPLYSADIQFSDAGKSLILGNFNRHVGQ